MLKTIENAVKGYVANKIVKTVLTPLDTIVDQNIMDVTTTIGSFIVRSVRGKFQRSITFTIGNHYADRWMEEALYGILYKYNNIKGSSRLELTNKAGMSDGTGIYYRLDDGTHNLKYRDYNILLGISTSTTPLTSGRSTQARIYTVITYDLDPKFMELFEKDMVEHRNSLLQIKKDSPVVNVYKDYHESDGYTYWEKMMTINKRKIGTVYLPYDQKKKLVDTINNFFSNKEYYKEHGVAHNLKILLYGPPGPQPESTNIPNPDGWDKLMKDFKPGDKIFTEDGSITEIEDIRKYEPMDVYKIYFSDGSFTRCALTHRWNVIQKDGSIVDNSVEDIINYLGTTKNNITTFDNDLYVPMGAEVQYDHSTNYKNLHPYVIGILAICGRFIGNNTNKKVCINTTESEILYYLRQYFPLDIYFEKYDDNNNWIMMNNCNPVYLDELLKIIPPGMVVYNNSDGCETIPSNYLYDDIMTRSELLSGIMDTTITDIIKTDLQTILTLSFPTPNLCLSTKRLMNSLGVRPTFVDATTLTVVCNSKVYSFIKYSSKKKLITLKYDLTIPNYVRNASCESDSVVKIELIEKTNEQEAMICFHVKDESHTYITENFISTCNTGKDSIAKMIASEWNRNIYYITGGKDGNFIPNAITDSDTDDINYPLMLISDIDKYPMFITEPKDLDENSDSGKAEKVAWKQKFGSMINALDGILSGEDRIIIMTTNHIEKFSETFRRPGRIDLELLIDYVTPEVFRKFIYDNFNYELPKDIKLKDDKLTIAKVQFDIMFQKMTVEEIIKKYIK